MHGLLVVGVLLKTQLGLSTVFINAGHGGSRAIDNPHAYTLYILFYDAFSFANFAISLEEAADRSPLLGAPVGTSSDSSVQ